MTPPIVRILVFGAVAAGIAGCAGAESTTSASSPAAESSQAVTRPATDPAPASPAPVAGCTGLLTGGVAAIEVDVRLAGGRVDPSPQRIDVTLGAHVVLRVETDTPTEIHVHGYDVGADAAPGTPACLEVVTDAPGVFDVEAHPDTLLLQLAVR